MRTGTLLSRTVWLFVGLVACRLVIVWEGGYLLSRPANVPIGDPPGDIPVEVVSFPSGSGATIRGWLITAKAHRGAVLLLHGVHANRLAMLDRARWLHSLGYTSLLIDFQASGESPGKAITFGHDEAFDAVAAVTYLKERQPGEALAVIGTSMGGAAALLARPALDVDALILEQVYPTIDQAVDDRLSLHLGIAGTAFAPLLLRTLPWHLGFNAGELRPIDRIGETTTPKLLIAGDADRHTHIDESLAMYAAAGGPKELWIVHGAEHVDLYRYTTAEYRKRVGNFLSRWLRPGQANLFPLPPHHSAADPPQSEKLWRHAQRPLALWPERPGDDSERCLSKTAIMCARLQRTREQVSLPQVKCAATLWERPCSRVL